MSTHTFNIHAAKTQLSELIARVEAGEEIVIARANRPVVKLVAIDPPKRSRTLGLNAGGIRWVAPDFDAPLAEDFLINAIGDVVAPKAAQKRAAYAVSDKAGAGKALPRKKPARQTASSKKSP